MKLNPAKCVFGVPAGKLLGFIVSQRVIEVNPEKIKAIQNIERPTCLKDIQRLMGSATAVSRFISRLGDKALPLYKLLKKSDNFVWTEEAEAALAQLKYTLTHASNLGSSAGKRAASPLHVGHKFRDKCCHCSGAPGGRETMAGSTPCLFY